MHSVLSGLLALGVASVNCLADAPEQQIALQAPGPERAPVVSSAAEGYPPSFRAMFRALFAVPEFNALLGYKARRPDAMDASGAIGRNITRFSDVAVQREASWLLLSGLSQSRPALIEKAVLALEYGFSKQTPDGYFRNGLDEMPTQAINADTFFLQASAQIYMLLQDSPFAGTYAERLAAVKTKSALAMSWLAQNTAEMRRQDGRTANRLAFDALAFVLNGKLLGDQGLVDIGLGYLNDVLALQTQDGYFMEKGGYDSSYQAVTLMNLQPLWLFVDHQQLRQRTFMAMVGGMSWLKRRILPSGEVMAEGNTRTGLGQESFFGKIKEINYGEVAFALFCWSVIAGDKEAEAFAKNVVRFALQKESNLKAGFSEDYSSRTK